MRLEALKLLERLEIWIFVIEMHHEPNRDQRLVKMIEERAPADAVGKRPTECVLHQARPVFFRRDLPQLFEAKPEFLRFATLVEGKPLDQRFAETAARPFRE